MRILLIKMSSLGDIIHTLPALTDAMQAIPELKVDWVIEPAFAEIPAWHPAVDKIIGFDYRNWRKNLIKNFTLNFSAFRQFYKTLREKKYDAVIDPQGLLKSGVITRLSRGPSHGYDKSSARESSASIFYRYRYAVDTRQHAVTRIRKLFAQSLGYPLPTTQPDFHINPSLLPTLPFTPNNRYLVFLHGTTWDTKYYPEPYWKALLEKTEQAGITVYLPWGNQTEKDRAEKFARYSKHAHVLPKLTISQMATLLRHAQAVLTVDTGLYHLSAAFNTPTIVFFGPSDSNLVGGLGDNQIYLNANFPCAPCLQRHCAYAKTHKTAIVPACFTTIDATMAWEKLEDFLHAKLTK